MKKTIEELMLAGDAPPWMNYEGYKTIARGYLLPNETPKQMYQRAAKAAAKYQKNSQMWEEKFFDYMWKNWLCLATPVLSNMGAGRGLPISCYSVHVEDSVDSIFHKNTELALLSKHGGGVGIYLGDVRCRGSAIKGNGHSEGIVPWAKVYDTTTQVISQGNARRGAAAVYLDIEHGDIEEFLNIRRPIGDVNRRCMNLNHGVCITDEWMKSMLSGDKEKRLRWQDILKSRVETGEPYIFFSDNVNKGNPRCYTELGLKVKTSNICTEITLFTDPEHTFVCCLSSLNLSKYDEWKNTDLVETSVRYLDSVMEEFIVLTADKPGFESARRSAIKGRALGLGVLGWHSLLQEKGLEFDSFDAMKLNAEIFRTIRIRTDQATVELANEFGEPEWCVGSGRRNTHTIAIAPTVSNSAISGGVSAGIEPLAANILSIKSAKGTFFRKNPTLTKILQGLDKDTPEIWGSINTNGGSVQHLDFLDEHQKRVFLTARELNQHSIIKQAAQRQGFIDQSQSVNIFFPFNADPKYIHQVHIAAWELGLKTLYYLRTEGVIKGDSIYKGADECVACGG
jgi:ribonucleoside-diphosphate reductase alpha chain